MKVIVAVLLFALFAGAFAVTTSANADGSTTFSVTPTTSQTRITALVRGLKPGDVLQFLQGTYNNLRLDLTGLLGTADKWITIVGINATIKTSGSLSPITIGTGAGFVHVAGLTISTGGVRNIAGVVFKSGVANVILSGLTLKHINGIGIDLTDVSNLLNIVITGCDISGTGQVGSSSGVGISVGGLTVAVTNVVNIQIVNNVIHDLGGKVASAIHVLLGVVHARVIDNVVWNVARGTVHVAGKVVNGAIVVVTGVADKVIDDLAFVTGNLVLDTASGLVGDLTTTVGLIVGAGTQVANNIIVNVDVGIKVVVGGLLTKLTNLTIAHNTVYKVTVTALELLDGVLDSTTVIVNNALAVGNSAVATVLKVKQGLLTSVAKILNNVVQGELGVDLDGSVDLDLDLAFVSALLNDVFSGLSALTADLKLLPARALLNNVVDFAVDAVNQVGELVTVDILPEVEELVRDLVKSIKQLLKSLNLEKLLNPILGAVTDVVEDVVDTVDDVVEDVVDTVDDVVEDVAETVEDLVASLDKLFPALVVDKVVDGALGKVTAVLAGIEKTLGQTLKNVGGLLGGLGGVVGGVVGSVGGSVGGSVNGSASGSGSVDLDLSLPKIDLKSVFAKLEAALAQVVDHVQAEAKALVGGVVDTLHNVLAAIADGVAANVDLSLNLKGLNGVVKTVVALVENVLEAVDELLAQVTGLVDFDGNLRVGRLTIGARQVGDLNIVHKLLKGFKGVVVVAH